MKKLPDKPTLADYQTYLKEVNTERGFKETVQDVFVLLVEEVGEFAKAIRKRGVIKVDKNSKEHNVEEEAADVFYLLINLCNHLNIDLEKAFRNKEKKNQKRHWS
ncbi:MAG TPA: MazG nucleotide pyrophosphohydrolase domain-containing protein [Candidatus Nitrosopolaris sp.]|nr:MazG nucleotide pyrophosphohydrolase domain-containing protein [Candidatus Nitrosopolaris sp.]